MKRILSALALAVATFSAAASPVFTIVPGTPAGASFNISQFDAVNSVYNTKAKFLNFLTDEGFSLSNAQFGSLFFDAGPNGGEIRAEYLGKEAGFTNLFTLTGGSGTLSTRTSIFGSFGGDTIGSDVAAGNNAVLGLFSSVQSGRSPANVLFIVNSTGTEALGLFNDSGSSDRDFDDMVVRFSGTAGDGNISPIPEPGSLALMLAGLGAMGIVARRRKA